MKELDCNEILAHFQTELYNSFNRRGAVALSAVNAVCSKGDAGSVVEFTLSEWFPYDWTNLYKMLSETDMSGVNMAKLVAPSFVQSKPVERGYWLFGVDVTPAPRPYARTLSERQIVYQPTVVKGNKPITIGHRYSFVGYLPPFEEKMSRLWVVPLKMKRVKATANPESVGMAQLKQVLSEPEAAWANDPMLRLVVTDSKYGQARHLHELLVDEDGEAIAENTVQISRVAGNRVFYRQYAYPDGEEPTTKPRQYGERFALKDEATWGDADEQSKFLRTTSSGKRLTITCQGWHDLIMSGKNKPKRLRMSDHPFTLVRIVQHDENGEQVGKVMWLIIIGEKRRCISVREAFDAYSRRYDLEHFFRFGKNRLLMDSFQTPDTKREEAWWTLTCIAYLQLWIARHALLEVSAISHPWQRYSKNYKAGILTPSQAQNRFGTVISAIETPASPPKQRGISPGRQMGTTVTPRTREQVIVKGKKNGKPAPK